MRKLSISLLTSLIALGLLCTSNTNAMKYTVDGDTSIAIPDGTYAWITIKRCDECEPIEFKRWSTWCFINTIWWEDWVPHIECTKSYWDSNEHTVTVTSTNNYTFSTLYLSNANVKNITNFAWFENIWNLYLTRNPWLSLWTNTFSTLNSDVRIYLTNNELTNFSTSVSNIKWLYLNNNELDIIPSNIRSVRNGNYIELSPSVKWGDFNNSNNKKFYLNDNPINFIDILSPTSSTLTSTSINFSWFWFSHEHQDWNLTYTYTLTKNWQTTPISTQSNYDSTQITIENLTDWTYTFEVCIDNITTPNICKKKENFSVSLPRSLSITKPAQNGTEIDSSDYTFEWNWSHPYLDKFCYTLSKDWWWYTTKSDCTTSKSLLVTDLVEGNYTLNVAMQNSESIQLGSSVSRTFKVNYNRSLNIPNINTITQKEHTFTWNWTAEDFNNYTYSLDGTTNWYHTSDTITNNNFTVSNLIDWEYTLTVIMNCDWETLRDTQTFDVNLDRSLSISSNPSWTITRNNVTWVDVRVSWNWDNDWFSKYNYKLIKNWSVYGDPWTSTNKSDTKLYEMLPSWTYKFHIDMLNSTDWIITSGDVNFTIIIPTTLTINIPIIDKNNVTLWWTWFAENFSYYEYTLDRRLPEIAWEDILTREWWIRSGYSASFTKQSLKHGNYTLTVNMKDSSWNTITGKNITFQILDNLSLSTEMLAWNTKIFDWDTINSRSATFTRSWQSEDLAWFYYEISGTTFKNETYKESWIQTSGIDWELYKAGNWSISLSNLQTGKYKFTVKMLAWDSIDTAFHEKSIEFYVKVPATLTIISPKEWATLTSSRVNFSWTWYNDEITRYEYNISKVWDIINQDQNNIVPKTSTSFSRDLANWNYVLTVWISSWWNLVAEDSVQFTVAVPPKVSWWSSWKSHYTNNLKLSLWNDSPAANEWIKLIVKIDNTYVWKVTFPRLQHYSSDTEKREDIPVTSKNYISDYSDDAKLWYIKFASDEDWRKDLEQFIKFSKNWYYRIFAEDKDWYDTYIEFKVSNKTAQTPNVTENKDTPTNNNINTIIQKYIPDISKPIDTAEEVYIARSCKKYTIQYSDSLNVYTSPNLNLSEYFISKEYFKRYVDSKNKYQSWCPTNIWWISTNYADRTNDNTRYTAPNGKVYFITWRDWNYYSNELNKELKTPTSFRTIQELKYYIRDRNPLISMAALWPTN